MGRILLHMTMSLDGMVAGPNGELDWIANDTPLNQDHLERLQQAKLLLLGSGVIPEMSRFWVAAERDEDMDLLMRNVGRAMNEVPKIVYSHRNITVDWQNSTVHVIGDNDSFMEDVKRARDETDGTIIVYGGVRFARSLVQNDLLDEIHFDICPLMLGVGQPLFVDLKHRTDLKLRESAVYDSGAAMLHYDVVRT